MSDSFRSLTYFYSLRKIFLPLFLFGLGHVLTAKYQGLLLM